ncbi:MAG: 6-phosphogluconolactonase, partial [Terriglobales bacterium]
VPDALRHPTPTSLPPDACAAAYLQDVRNHLVQDAAVIPRFPLIILGLGADGHTASLFPHTRLYADNNALIRTADATADHPHPRLTFTPALINAAAEVWFLITGAAKADAVARLHARSGPPAATPALVVDPDQTRITYFCDAPAAANLPTR